MAEQKIINVEYHPFKPFLPERAKVLFLGSFPPQPKRWCMAFYYPNWMNDFWRCMGLIFFDQKDYFTVPGEKRFDVEKIRAFCTEKGIALYDTATAVRRLKENASDKFLEVVVPTDIPAMLAQIPECKAIVATGQKAADTLCNTFGCGQPQMNGSAEILLCNRQLLLYRMPSTSRAYPLSLEKKAASYRKIFNELALTHPTSY